MSAVAVRQLEMIGGAEDAAGGPSGQDAWELLEVLSKHLSLGDARLKKRTLNLARTTLRAQSSSEAALAGDKPGAEKATQRYMVNERVEVQALREALYGLSLERAEQLGVQHLVAVFDPTDLNYSEQCKTKEQLKAVGKAHVPGYVWLNLALFDPQSAAVLGIGHQTLLGAAGADDREHVDYKWLLGEGPQAEEEQFNPKQHFMVHLRELDRRAPPGMQLTAVADMEFDDAFAIRAIGQHLSDRMHFVLRSDEQRVVQVHWARWTVAKRKIPSPQKALRGSDEPDLVDIYLHDVARLLPKRRFRNVPLDARGRLCFDGRKPARIARLSIGAVPIRLSRKSTRGERQGAEEQPLWLNLVIVDEPHPPTGSKPLHWALLTDWPIQSLEQQTAVVDRYQGRGRVEELFRTTNDVLKLEDSKLHSLAATARLLFLITIKALFLDSLRLATGIHAGSPPTKEQRQALREGAQEARRIEKLRTSRAKRPPKFSVPQRAMMLLGLIAQYGGWSNHPRTSLGNYVLSRGLHAFLPLLSHGLYPWLLGDVGG
jgi:hypothetical protein